jgi:hypothetical protein
MHTLMTLSQGEEARMNRREITADLVHRAEQMLTVGIAVPTIAAQLGTSRYVVGVIAGDLRRPGPPPPERKVTRRIPGACRSIDVGTMRLVRRMLDARYLNLSEIAREAGVSDSTVSDVALGKRDLGQGLRPRLREGEQYVREGARCPHCGAMVVVLPCRACVARRN